ncbi:MAG: polymer-forming cytoskeletal protein [Candidatus Cryptobacteroides sp.]
MSVKPQTPVVNVNEVSRISTGSVIKGEISSPNDIRIDGSFEGRIFCSGRVVAGEKAEIKGDIVCENVDFWGKLEGSLYVKDTLTLKDTCSVNGDLHVKRLVVELGAHFDGTCKMLSEGEFEKVAGALTGHKPAQQKPAASQPAAPAVS